MLLKLADFARKSDTLKRPYKGIVLSNADPRNIGRVKAQVPGIFDSIDIDLLPWIQPWNPVGMGGRGDISYFSSLEIGSEIVVEFPYGDVYAPFYTGLWQSAITHNGVFDEDYPNTYGFIDNKGNGYRVDRTKQITEIFHSSGSRVELQQDSTIEIQSRKGVRFISEDGKTELFIDLENGNFNLTPKGELVLGGQKNTLSARETVIDTSSLKQNVSGSIDTEVIGGKRDVIGGCYSSSILSNKAESVGGSYSQLIAQSTERIYGLDVDETYLGDHNATLNLGNLLVSALLGNIEFDSVTGSIKLGGSLAKLKLQNGKVGLGNASAELVDLVSQLAGMLDSTLSAIEVMTMPTGVGPSGIPINVAQFTSIQSQLAAIKILIDSIKGGI